MEIIILTVILGLGIAFFATQNGGLISLYFGPYVLPNVSIYLAIVGALLLGLLLAWLFYLLRSFSSSMTLHNRENKLKEANRTIAHLTKSVHQLEIDNARLREKSGEEESSDDKSL
jgi:cell shape-determining protein MreC